MAISLLVVIIVVMVLGIVQLLRKPPSPSLSVSAPTSSVIPGTLPALPWPSQGAADVGVVGIGTTGNHGVKAPIGLASVAKIITALVILKDHPLSIGQSGPTLTVSASDVATYQQMLANVDSVVVVSQGETLSEFQALEALLIPSADNVAVMLANWDAGSVSAFAAKMNQEAASLGMTSSHYVDPSGLDPNTAGTAPDQVIAATALMQNPVLAQIVAMPQATLPVVGLVYNVNALVGHDNIIGVKTGSTPAGGNFTFAGTTTLPASSALPRSVASSPTIVGAILGQQGYTPLPTALSAGKALLDAFRTVPTVEKIVGAGVNMGSITAPGQNSVGIVTGAAISIVGWPGLKVVYKVAAVAKLPASFGSGFKVGTLTATLGQESVTVPLLSTGAVKAPSLTWRLERL
ncbi:MAG: D-alanyl-D-alanine carboxypeptidase [Actinomycetota bacterium]|nr:D-alanyl-D-alanine carboxypeptidase [Actinomycetota bacterium]